MQFFQSLLCIKGSDNRSRFLVINIALYFLFIVLSALGADNTLFSIIVLITITTLSAFSIIRRLNDAKLNKNWMPISPVLLFLCGMTIILVGHAATYWLLLLPLGLLALLLTYPSKQAKTYILGYNGPIDLSQYTPRVNDHSKRIEPSLVGENNVSFSIPVSENDIKKTISQHQSSETKDIGELIRELLFNNKNAVITVASILSLAIVGMLISSLLGNSSSESTAESSDEQLQPTQTTKASSHTRQHPIKFPDNFSLMISEYSGLFIHWQADETEQTILWSQDTAKGDKACSKITFNNKKSLRTLSVQVESGGDYYAKFSPLDTSTLLNHLAYRGSFNLCGYKFSLKGSQAILGKNHPYSELVEY